MTDLDNYAPESWATMPLEFAPKVAAVKKVVDALTRLGMSPHAYSSPHADLILVGARTDLKLGLEVRYSIGETATGRVSVKFLSGKVCDPVGIVRNLEADYTIGKQRAKQLGITDAEAKRIGDARAAEYNDGGQWRVTRAELPLVRDLNEWLEDWLELLAPAERKERVA